MSAPKISLILSLFLVIFLFRVHSIAGLHQRYTNNDYNEWAENLKPLSLYLDHQIRTILPETQASILSGILIGVQTPLPPELKLALTNTSTIHIVVVSGQNLSMLVGFIMAAATLLGRRKTILLSLALIIFYSLLTGLQVPVLRAAIMAFLILFAELLGKDRDSWWILALAGGGMLIYNPNWLLSISFQLSFMATLGALVVAKNLTPILKFLPETIREAAAVSLSAQLLTMPIIAANFHQISLIGLIANIFVLWTVSPIMISGLVALGASIILGPLSEIFSLIPYILLTYFIDIITFFNQLPFAYLRVDTWNIYLSIGCYLLLGGAFIYLQKLARAEKPALTNISKLI